MSRESILVSLWGSYIDSRVYNDPRRANRAIQDREYVKPDIKYLMNKGMILEEYSAYSGTYFYKITQKGIRELRHTAEQKLRGWITHLADGLREREKRRSTNLFTRDNPLIQQDFERIDKQENIRLELLEDILKELLEDRLLVDTDFPSDQDILKTLLAYKQHIRPEAWMRS